MTNHPVIQELKRLVPIAIPAVLSQLAQMAMGVIDTLMAGHYSNEALAAIAVGTSILHPVLVFFLGLFLALNPIVAHFRGADETHLIGPHFRAGMLLAVLFTPIAMLVLINAKVLLNLMGINAQIAELADGYLHATALGMLPLLLFLALRFCNEGLFSTDAIMLVTVGSIPFNIGLNYWFMYGAGPIPAMGAVGVGYATSLVWLLMFAGLFIWSGITKRYRAYKIFQSWHLPPANYIWDILKLGLPMAITLGFEITMFAAIALLIARYPVESIGAHQIAVNIASVTFMIPLGISQAITARVGYCRGKNQLRQASLAGYTGIGCAALIMALSALMMFLIPATLVGLYTSDPTLSQLAVSLLGFAAIFQFSDGLQVSSAGALRGLKDTRVPMLITAFAYWVIGIPAGYYVAEISGYGFKGYWIGLIAGLSTAAVLLLWRWKIFAQQMGSQASTNEQHQPG